MIISMDNNESYPKAAFANRHNQGKIPSTRSQETDTHYASLPKNYKPATSSLGVVNVPPGSRGPRSLYLKRNGESFGFTLRHFIVYPPDGITEDAHISEDGKLAAVGALSTPMDTIFVKRIKDRHCTKAGLQPGDRLVAVNGIPVTDKSYSQVVALIQNSPDYLHLLVVPKEDDLLQRYFSETAYNPATNQTDDVLGRFDQTRESCRSQQKNVHVPMPPIHDHQHVRVDAKSWYSLRNPYGLLTPQSHLSHVKTMSLQPNSFHTLDFEPWKRPSAMTNSSSTTVDNRTCVDRRREPANTTVRQVTYSQNSAADGSKDSLSSFDSLASTLTSGDAESHETDDSAIMTHYKRTFQQKERFLNSDNSSSSKRSLNESSQKFATLRPQWNVENAHAGGRMVNPLSNAIPAAMKPLTRGDINATIPFTKKECDDGSAGKCENGYLKHLSGATGVKLVQQKAKEFESGKPVPIGEDGGEEAVAIDRTHFHRSELARISAKRVVPNVNERAQEFESLMLKQQRSFDTTSTSQSGEENSIVPTSKADSTKVASDSATVKPAPLSGNATIISSSKYIHCPLPSDGRRGHTEEIPRRTRLYTPSSKLPRTPELSDGDATVNPTVNNAIDASIQGDWMVETAAPTSLPIEACTARGTDVESSNRHTKDDAANIGKAADDTVVVVKRRVKPTYIANEEDRSVRRQSYLKATEGGRMNYFDTVSDSDATKTADLMALRSGSVSDNSGSSASLDRDKATGSGAGTNVAAPSASAATEATSVDLINNNVLNTGDRNANKDNALRFRPDKEGTLHCKITEVEGKRFSDRSWKQVWIVLKGPKLFLYKDKHTQSPIGTSDGVEHSLVTGIDMRSSVVRIADDYTKRKNVLRVSTPSPCRTEVLLQADTGEDLNEWVKALRHQMANELDMKFDDIENHQSTKPMANLSHTETLCSPSSGTNCSTTNANSVSPSIPVASKWKPHITIPANNSLSVTSPRNRSPTGQSPVTKTRKSSSSSSSTSSISNVQHPPSNTMFDPASNCTSPKSKTWRGRVAKQFRKMHGGSTSPNATNAGSVGQNMHQSAFGLPQVTNHPLHSNHQSFGSGQTGYESNGSTFGVPLEQCIPSDACPFVPQFVQICTEIVEERGLQTVGIYRVPGNNASITALSEEVNRHYEHVPLEDPKWSDVHVVSSLLKSFFRKMPDSLVTNRLYPHFIKADKIPDAAQRLVQLKQLVQALPPYNYHTLKHLVCHLHTVVEHSDANKMEAKNLAIVFGPTIIRPEDDNMESMVNNMTHQCKIVETLLTCSDWFFAIEDNESGSNECGSSDDVIMVGGVAIRRGQDFRPLEQQFGTDGVDEVHGRLNHANQHLLLDNISKYEALKEKEKNGALFSSIISAAQRKVKRKTGHSKHHTVQYHDTPHSKDESLTSNLQPQSVNNISTHSVGDAKEDFIGRHINKRPQNKADEINTVRDSTSSMPTETIHQSTDSISVCKHMGLKRGSTNAAKKLPWFNYTTDREEFHRRIENFELETKAMLEMPRNLEISVCKTNASLGGTRPVSAQLESTVSGVLSSDGKSLLCTPEQMQKAQSASNVCTRSTVGSGSNNTHAGSQKDQQQYLYCRQIDRHTSSSHNTTSSCISNTRRYRNNSRNQNEKHHGIIAISDSYDDNDGKDTTVGSKCATMTSWREHSNSQHSTNRSCTSNKQQLRRGSSVESLHTCNQFAESNSTNVTGTGGIVHTKKVKYELELENGLRRSGSVDSLSTIPGLVVEDESDLVTSLTKLYDRKLMEDKKASGVRFDTDTSRILKDDASKIYDQSITAISKTTPDNHNILNLLSGDGLPYVDESPERKPVATKIPLQPLNNKQRIAHMSSEINKPDHKNDFLYRNPSLHKGHRLAGSNLTSSGPYGGGIDEVTLDCKENCSELHSYSRPIERWSGGSGTSSVTLKLRRSESLNKDHHRNSLANSPLRRSDSLTKTEKTECNNFRKREFEREQMLAASSQKVCGGGGVGLNRTGGYPVYRHSSAREPSSRQSFAAKLKRKNGMPDRSIKRRHTVGGTKDPDKVTWCMMDNRYSYNRMAQPHNAYDCSSVLHHHDISLGPHDMPDELLTIIDCARTTTDSTGGGGSTKDCRRSSSPDLLTTTPNQLCVEINVFGAPENLNMVMALKQGHSRSKTESSTSPKSLVTGGEVGDAKGMSPRNVPTAESLPYKKAPLESHV